MLVNRKSLDIEQFDYLLKSDKSFKHSCEKLLTKHKSYAILKPRKGIEAKNSHQKRSFKRHKKRQSKS